MTPLLAPDAKCLSVKRMSSKIRFGNGAFRDGLVRQRIEDIDRQLALLNEMAD